MRDYSTMKYNMIMGTFMMVTLYFLVMSFIDNEYCIENNDTADKQQLCLDFNSNISNFMNYGMLVYMISIGVGLFFIIRQHLKKKQIQQREI